MTKWEYQVLILKENDKNTLSRLNAYGNAEWELVAIVEGEGLNFYRTFFFKRPRQ